MDTIQDYENMAPEILAFMNQAFSNCSIASQFYPEENAWKFQLQFMADKTGSYLINPPQGVCLMKVHATGPTIIFQVVLFVEDFKRLHAPKMMN